MIRQFPVEAPLSMVKAGGPRSAVRAVGCEELQFARTPHVRSIYAKLQASDRSSAVQRARELQLLSPDRTHSTPRSPGLDHA